MSYYNTRNRLASAAINKINNDQRLKEINRDLWYSLAEPETLPQFQQYLRLNEDMETQQFISDCFEKSDWFFHQLFHSLMISLLRMFMATTSINGLLNRGSMFVFSVQQFSMLIEFETTLNSIKMDNLLDLGAGDGAVTAKMAPFFKNVYATEMSLAMQWRLKQKGYKVLNVDDWDIQNTSSSESSDASNNFLKYDTIACLNLLDRCDKPVTLLKQIKNALKPNGLLIVALVLPFKPFVEYNKNNKPTENLLDFKTKLTNVTTCEKSIQNESSLFKKSIYKGKMLNKINFQINFFVEEIFEPLGFDLLKLTRLPYLCEGNMEQSFYYLHDYVFILKSRD